MMKMTIGEIISIIDEIEETKTTLKKLREVFQERQFTACEGIELIESSKTAESLLMKFIIFLQNYEIKDKQFLIPFEKEFLESREGAGT